MVLCVFQCEIREIWVKNKLFLRFMYVFYEITRFLGKRRLILSKNKLFLRFMYVFYEITRFLGKRRLILSKLQMIYANKCSILFSFRKLNTFRLKRTLKIYLRAGETKKFSVFHVENGKIQSMLWFYVCFNVENTCNLG